MSFHTLFCPVLLSLACLFPFMTRSHFPLPWPASPCHYYHFYTALPHTVAPSFLLLHLKLHSIPLSFLTPTLNSSMFCLILVLPWPALTYTFVAWPFIPCLTQLYTSFPLSCWSLTSIFAILFWLVYVLFILFFIFHSIFTPFSILHHPHSIIVSFFTLLFAYYCQFYIHYNFQFISRKFLSLLPLFGAHSPVILF